MNPRRRRIRKQIRKAGRPVAFYDRETDGRWIADDDRREVSPAVYGETRRAAWQKLLAVLVWIG